MDDKLPTKTAKIMSPENLYIYSGHWGPFMFQTP